ncbi:hypothetical protein HYFRA_00006319 [Hymenoscyphus fraxineus]|uniref:DNA topoisomerase (ATP-hydrolyzing) n=1 Tax=Hymenoscyphus fraxineus TaxID=746836 RepID=A0A9N9PVU9_9HELO|nr:hypothetical protein HYFRA_00006319 [Hymenoscyphus fraxineus]
MMYANSVYEIMNEIGDPQNAQPKNLLSNLTTRPLIQEQNAFETENTRPTAEKKTMKTAMNPRSTPGAVISRIEHIFEDITDCLLDGGKELAIPLKSRHGNRSQTEQRDGTEGMSTSETRLITFPNKSPREARRFTILLRILELSHEALVTGIVTTKRDIYYRDPELFVKQAVVDRYVDDIAYTFGVERDALNVVAAAKGLIAGSFTVTRKDGSTIDFSVENEGTLVPNSKDLQNVQFQEVEWILVIEKEATFRTLATSKYWQDSLAGKGIIITAKGYPDIQTRQFLHLLSTQHASCPIFALVDFDPDGLGILSIYKHGSAALAHEPNLAVPSIQWLGVRSHDFLHEELDLQGLLRLTSRDRRIAGKMLGKKMFEEEGCESECRRELQVMLMLNVKAEIQILGNGERLGAWLDGKLKEGIGKVKMEDEMA